MTEFIFPKIQQLKTENNTTIIKSELIEKDSNKIAWMERGYNSDRKEYYMLNSEFQIGISKWVADVSIPLVKGKGIPTSLYLDLRAMKLLKIPSKGIEYFIIYNIHEWDSILKLHTLLKENPNTELKKLIKELKIFQSRENVIIQSGYIIEDIKVIMDGSIFTSINKLGIDKNDLKNLCNLYDLGSDEEIFWNFSIAIKVKNAF